MSKRRRNFAFGLVLFLVACFVARSVAAQPPQSSPTPTPSPEPSTSPTPAPPEDAAIEMKAFERLEWRNLGPGNMSGRVADIESVAGNPNVVYVASASGGLWKTTNAGVTWRPLFERQGTISIGDIALEPGNPDVVWLGTGESAVRNSVSFGDGVYKSTDGGKTWQHMGLRDTEHVSKILVNPRNPEVAYVGALGHAFGANDERGVYMTTDGGRTWARTLYVDNEHGVADMDIDPSNPNILYAVMWKFRRTPWTHTSGSERGGLFKSIDGGRTWKKLEGGLPKLVGRMGVAVAPSNPNIVYAITEAKEGTFWRSDDRGETWRNVSKQTSIVSRGFYYTHVRVDPTNENRVYAAASTLFTSVDGGRTFRPISGRTHVDFHAFWIDPLNPKRLWQGQDGGAAVSYDQGETWESIQNLPVGQFYQVFADNRQPFYYVMGGLQDNGTWTGPSRTREPAGILNDDWRMLSFGDGFYALNHPDDPELYLTESQGGNIVRTDFRTREQQLVAPYLGDDGGPALDAKYRFNWNSPIIPSPHDKNTVYLTGNVVFKSRDFGKTWTTISPDLTNNDKSKQQSAGGPVAFENTGAEYYETIISFAESPLRAGVLWAGTDDGNLQLSTDGGKNWTNLVRNVNGLAANSPVSHVEPSRADAKLTYVAFDRHLLDDRRPYVFKTTDEGRTWQNISGNLPASAYVWVVREDPKYPRLLYAGTELGLFISYTGGTNWQRLELKNLPHVAVHDIVIHPRENDLILATHGRGLWILDDATPIQQSTPEVLREDVHLFDVRPALRYTTRFTRYGIGDKPLVAPNPPYGALISYYLKTKPEDKSKPDDRAKADDKTKVDDKTKPDDKSKPKIQILDSKGKVIVDLENVAKEQGLNRVSWNLRYGGPQVRRPPTDEEVQFTGGPRGPQVLPGIYTVRLTVGGKTVEKPIEVRLDPTISVPMSDLQTQFDMQMKLRDMQTATNQALRTLDSLKSQLEFVEKTAKDRLTDVPKELSDKLTEQKKAVEKLQNTLAQPEGGLGIDGKAQLVDKIGGLFFSIDSSNAAPTPAMHENFAMIQKEFDEKFAAVNKFLRETVPQLNETLRRFDAPTLMTGKPIEMPKP
ncbi:MAG: glycosyl hydrolase [Acidobacteria bacterium]|nr:glycosyl hydrolase [Acidobacteriota bacterium]